MGQQQLLIIVVVMIIAWEVIWGSFRYIDAINQGNERDVLTEQMRSLIVDAIKYQMKPSTMGGGSGSMIGFQPPKSKSITDRFRIYTGTTEHQAVFSGFGSVIGTDEATPVHVILTYSAIDKNVAIEIIN